MKVVFGKTEFTCTAIETELGLARGDVTRVQILSDGTAEVETARELTEVEKTRLQELLAAAKSS